MEEYVRAVVRLEVVAGVCAEDAGLDVGQAPVGAYVEDFAAETGAGEVAAYDGTGERLEARGNLRYGTGEGLARHVQRPRKHGTS